MKWVCPQSHRAIGDIPDAQNLDPLSLGMTISVMVLLHEKIGKGE